MDPKTFIISAAKLKTHDRVVATLSLKNIVLGAPLKDDGMRWGSGSKAGAKSDKMICHGSGFRGINYNLFALAQKLHPHLAVIDGYDGMQGNGPMRGDPVDHRVCVVASVRDYHPPAARRGGISGVVLFGTEMRSRNIHTRESRVMVSLGDVEKRRAWAGRFARYRASGLSVARFCKQERVSPHTFYYWAKRLRTASSAAPSWTDRAIMPRHASTPSLPNSSTREAVVRFRWKSGAEVVVPADCLEAIRCLAKCLAEAGDCRGEPFQEVVIKA